MHHVAQRVIGQNRECLLRAGRPAESLGAGFVQRAMAAQQRQRVVQITLLLIAFLDGALPKGALCIIGARDGADHGQCQLALAEIIAGILADHPVAAAPIEQVVSHLKSDTQPIAIDGQRAYLGLGAFGDDAANLAGGLEQSGGLATDDLKISVLRGGDVHRGAQLQHLALGDHGSGVGQDR